MLYEVDADAAGASMKQVRKDTDGLQVSLSGARCNLIE
jgi:hypothetical protein